MNIFNKGIGKMFSALTVAAAVETLAAAVAIVAIVAASSMVVAVTTESRWRRGGSDGVDNGSSGTLVHGFKIGLSAKKMLFGLYSR